jgi:protein gp37
MGAYLSATRSVGPENLQPASFDGVPLICLDFFANEKTYHQIMSNITSIQWADTTVNPIMGCGGCELFPDAGKVLSAIAEAMNAEDPKTNATADSVKLVYKKLVDEVFKHSANPHPAHKQVVNTTNIWHLRDRFVDAIKNTHGRDVAKAASAAIRKAITCYAATLHLNKAANILDREGNRPGKDKPREVKKGYAPIFETVTQFEGRAMDKAAVFPDLLGCANPKTPWKERLPRLIFVSDMGDALSAKADFPFLKKDLMPAIESPEGKRHLWLWLTKRPQRMAQFADEIGGFPTNVCAMTTLTGPDEESLKRLADLKQVKAHIKGLSIEPLWKRIPPSKLNLKGIDWVILGGESGSGFKFTRPFALEWAEELRDHCRKHGVAFFMKQLGRNPTRNGEVFRLKDKHGGEWEEWPDETLKIREFPKAFHNYRETELVVSNKPRPVKKPKNSKKKEDTTITPQDKADFKRLDKIVRQGIQAFAEAGEALVLIHEAKLWRVDGHKTWEDYCRSVAGMSKVHASRLMRASECMKEIKALPIGHVFPVAESQVRPLLKLPDPEQRATAWTKAVEGAEGRQPTAIEVTEAVFEILPPVASSEKPETTRERRHRLIGTLRTAIQKRADWDKLESIVAELEELI